MFTPVTPISVISVNVEVFAFDAVHYENTPMQQTAIFHGCKNDIFRLKCFGYFHIFAQNIDCVYTLEPPHCIEAVLTSTHNLCFRAKIENNEYPCKPQFYYIKVGCKGVSIHGRVILMTGGFYKAQTTMTSSTNQRNFTDHVHDIKVMNHCMCICV